MPGITAFSPTSQPQKQADRLQVEHETTVKSQQKVSERSPLLPEASPQFGELGASFSPRFAR